MVGLCPPFAPFVTFRYSRTVSGRPFDRAPPWRWGSPPPQGSSLGCKLCCLAPSSLNRPHPPHPRAHCDFTAWRLIRNAFAVRERRGDPRVVPGFRCPFLPNMPSSLTPGSSIIVWSRTSMSTWPSPSSEQLGTPDPPAIRFTRGTYFGASRFTHLLRPAKLLAPLYGSDRYARPSGAFTSRLPTDRLPSPLLDMTTTATGLLCWRDFHPPEWQLASLHQIRTCSFPAYGSRLGWMRAPVSVYAAAPLTREPGSESRTCFADAYSPWPPPFAPPTPPRAFPLQDAPQVVLPLCSPASSLLWLGPTSRVRASSATAPRLPNADRPAHATPDGQTRDLPGSDAIPLHVMWPLTPAGRQHLA